MKQINPNSFKIRCSAIGTIMTNPRNKSEEISATTLSYCDQWVKEQLYEREKEFTSKYTDKGISVEADAIQVISQHKNLGLVFKNEEHFEDEYFTGTPDLILSDMVADVKAPYSCFTFPLLATECPEKAYFGQLQGYMRLTGKKKAMLAYAMMDAPEFIIEKECRSKMYELGLEEVSIDLYEEVKETMIYSHLPLNLRVKSFEFAYDETYIQEVIERVELCRKHIGIMIKSIQP